MTSTIAIGWRASGRALEESAIDELAADQRPLRSGPRNGARPEIERAPPVDEPFQLLVGS
jgi:hypothetical protein